jgi:hypothetical protein
VQSRVSPINLSGPSSFFRRRLLTLTTEEISAMVDQMDQEADSIRKQSLKMSWYMRGGATYEDVMQMSNQERKMVSELIKDNLETTKNSKLPFF